MENGSQHDRGGGDNDKRSTADSTCSIKHNRCHYCNPHLAFNVVSDTFFLFSCVVFCQRAGFYAYSPISYIER